MIDFSNCKKGDMVSVIENEYEFIMTTCNGRQIHLKDHEGEYIYSPSTDEKTMYKLW